MKSSVSKGQDFENLTTCEVRGSTALALLIHPESFSNQTLLVTKNLNDV